MEHPPPENNWMDPERLYELFIQRGEPYSNAKGRLTKRPALMGLDFRWNRDDARELADVVREEHPAMAAELDALQEANRKAEEYMIAVVKEFDKIEERNTKLRILMDMDGVVTDFDGHLDPRHRNRTCRNFSDDPSIPAEEKARLHRRAAEPGFFLTMPEIPGAVDAIKALLKRGHEVAFCTKPMVDSGTCSNEKALWIKERFPEEWRRMIVMTWDKTLVNGWDVLVDDDPNVVSKGSRNPDWKHVLYPQPWNVRERTYEGCPSVGPWSDTAVEEVERVLREAAKSV